MEMTTAANLLTDSDLLALVLMAFSAGLVTAAMVFITSLATSYALKIFKNIT